MQYSRYVQTKFATSVLSARLVAIIARSLFASFIMHRRRVSAIRGSVNIAWRDVEAKLTPSANVYIQPELLAPKVKECLGRASFTFSNVFFSPASRRGT